MKHIMMDCYNASKTQLNDLMHINNFLTEVIYKLGLEPICPPYILPYYYGKVKEDIGISAYVLLVGGHITIHTFPIRECYFLDVFSQGDFDENILIDILKKELPYSDVKSNVVTKKRFNDFEMLPYDPKSDFGPHLMINIDAHNEPTMDELFNFLENTAYDINMDPITRPCVLKSTINNPKYLSGIIIIAQSHISVHYSYETHKIYGDIFSCAPFDFSTVEAVFEKLGKKESIGLCARGTKHVIKVKSQTEAEDLLASTKWQNVIKNK